MNMFCFERSKDSWKGRTWSWQRFRNVAGLRWALVARVFFSIRCTVNNLQATGRYLHCTSVIILVQILWSIFWKIPEDRVSWNSGGCAGLAGGIHLLSQSPSFLTSGLWVLRRESRKQKKVQTPRWISNLLQRFLVQLEVLSQGLL